MQKNKQYFVSFVTGNKKELKEIAGKPDASIEEYPPRSHAGRDNNPNWLGGNPHVNHYRNLIRRHHRRMTRRMYLRSALAVVLGAIIGLILGTLI